MAETRATQARRTRDLIVAVAEKLFATEGYDPTSLQMIADAAGITKANVYYYFHTKAAILEAALSLAVESVRQVLEQAAGIADVGQRRQFVLDSYVQLLMSRRDRLLAFNAEPTTLRVRQAGEAVALMRAQAAALLFGPRPTARQRMAFALLLALEGTIHQLADVSDAELADVLHTACDRLLLLAESPPPATS